MKSIIFSLVVLLTYFNACSQSKSKFNLGIKAGYVNSYNSTPGIVYSTTIDKGHLNSFSGGISGNYNFGEHLSLEADLLFTGKGYSLNSFQLYDVQGNKLDMTTRHSYNMSYLDLPVYIKYSFGKKVQPFIGVGAALSFNVSHNYGKPYIQGTGGWDSIYIAPSNKPASLYCSFFATAGVSFKRFSAQAIYMLGLIDAINAGNLTMSQGYTQSYWGMYIDKSPYTHTLYYPTGTVKATHLNSFYFIVGYRIFGGTKK